MWRPRRVLITRAAREWAHGRAIAEHAARLGIALEALPRDRVTFDFPEDPHQAYAAAKQTLVIVVAPPSKRKLQPIAPSVDRRIDLAKAAWRTAITATSPAR